MIYYTPIEPESFGLDYDAIEDINLATKLTTIY